MNYAELTLRNAGYISPEAQQHIRDTRLLIAGCGMGSAFAETAVRLGYEKLMLVDHDIIEAHNLNRQSFTVEDISRHKVHALKQRLLAINPHAQVEAICAQVTAENAEGLVTRVDLVFDTIDFLDLPGLVALHDACHVHHKALITAVSAGFGAVALYFPERKRCTIRDLFELPRQGSVEGISYGERYATFIRKHAHRLDPAVVNHFFHILALLDQGQPCPASQVAPGSACVAALAGTVAVRLAQGLPVAEAPEMLIINMAKITQHSRP